VRADVLVKPRRMIGPEHTLRAFANDVFLGLIDRMLLREVPQGYWDTRTVAETMLPVQHMETIIPRF
jgi:hypothetical protein